MTADAFYRLIAKAFAITCGVFFAAATALSAAVALGLVFG